MKNWLKKIGDVVVSGYKAVTKEGSRRRIAIISSTLTTIGAYTEFAPLWIAGTLGTAIFGTLDAKDNKEEYKKLLGLKKNETSK